MSKPSKARQTVSPPFPKCSKPPNELCPKPYQKKMCLKLGGSTKLSSTHLPYSNPRKPTVLAICWGVWFWVQLIHSGTSPRRTPWSSTWELKCEHRARAVLPVVPAPQLSAKGTTDATFLGTMKTYRWNKVRKDTESYWISNRSKGTIPQETPCNRWKALNFETKTWHTH